LALSGSEAPPVLLVLIIISNSKNKTKTSLNFVTTVTRNKVSVNNISLINVNDNLTNDSQIIANVFDKYFLTVVENVLVENVNDKNSLLNDTNPLECLHTAFKQPFPNMKQKCKTTNKSEEIIKSLKIKNFCGYDGISTKILKLSMSYISSPLTYICNKMISTGTFPSRLKFS
jgi:hypothetical protein